ncbi:MAG: S1 RNA-binding domain-containing protein [Pirellulaceae bacterium]|nr:S1 RNA-binding domain-containing protein [Pirellulaceae bacterium]
MTDLSGIARHLRLSVDQIRLAVDLLEQGYSPAFIHRYRADETGQLARSVLWRLKSEVDRQRRLDAIRSRALQHLPKDAVLDAEAEKAVHDARTAAAVDVALRCFRARRNLLQISEPTSVAGKLLESMIKYSGPAIADVTAWVAESQSLDSQAAQQLLNQTERLIGSLIGGDSLLHARLRQAVIRKAQVTVQSIEESNSAAPTSSSDRSQPSSSTDSSSDAHDDGLEDHHQGDLADEHDDESVGEHVDDTALATESELSSKADSLVADNTDAPPADGTSTAQTAVAATDPAASKPASRASAKLTPRQRRRKWLISALSPLRTLNKPLGKLSAYQQLILGRGMRSQLVRLVLNYEPAVLTELARDSFVSHKHPLAGWFTGAVANALDSGLRSRIETDALMELEEQAGEQLLEHATDDLRRHLLRRPVRGHTIAVIDTVGPRTVVVAIVDSAGQVLCCDELPCSVQPDVVSQNVVRLGELIHQYRVTLVGLTNGPARRFMVVTVRELMQQSKDSGLRWTMVDRSGAEAYAGSRIGLKELATHNRRQRAAIWAARSLQDPLFELLKVDVGRLRLGSYQRELQQDSLRQLVLDTISECVCLRGLDTQHANLRELQYIPGVGPDQAQQIHQLASSGQLVSRQQLQSQITGWSDVDKRQAIGWLRVFGSTCTLDATLIHPDDYRLAERLIENSELSAPPAAPAGWKKRTVELAASAILADSTSSADSGAVVSGTAAEAGDNLSAPITDAHGTNSDSEPIASADLDAESPDGGQHSNSAAIIEVSSDSNENASVSASTEDQLSRSESAQPASPPAMVPEYPEQLPPASTSPEPTVDIEKLAKQWQVGRAKLKSIAQALLDPLGDARLQGTPVPLLSDMPTQDSLQPDTCLWAVVVGVAEFGAFVEIGPNCNGLVHISRLSPHFVEDPHQWVQVGDLLLTWVVNVDQKRNRVALTCLSPAQRAAAQAEAQQREADERSSHARGRHPQSGEGRPERGPRHGVAPRGQTSGGQPPGAGQRTGGGAPHSAVQGDTTHLASNDRRPRSDQGYRGRGQQGSGGGRGAGGQRGGPRGRGRGHDDSRPAKSVVVTSKQPKAPITQAMKQGDEPLRSFSDLMQFYQAQPHVEASDVPAPEAPQTSTVQNVPETAPVTASGSAEASSNQQVDGQT